MMGKKVRRGFSSIIILLLIIVLVAVVVGGVYHFPKSPGFIETFNLEKEPLPKLVTHNFIDLDRIQRISKYRGGYGHDFSHGTGESCRSMKHYFWAKGGMPQENHNPSWMTISYYAPVDGVIRTLRTKQNEHEIEGRFSLQSERYPAFYFEFFHVKLLEGLGNGSKIRVGQQLGTVGNEEAHGEIAVSVFTTRGQTLVSFFELISDSVFEEYKKRGITSTLDLIIPKEERDKNPLHCDMSTPDGRFIGDDGVWLIDSAGLNNWIELN